MHFRLQRALPVKRSRAHYTHNDDSDEPREDLSVVGPTPLAPELLGLDSGASVSPLNGQLTVNLLGVGHGAHSFAVGGALISPRWLISPDYRPNSRDIEARYYWRFHPDLRLDVRLRRRQDRWVPVGAARGRVDYDTYVRLNVYLR